MPDQKISQDPELAAPTTQARLAGIDPGTDATKNYKFGSDGISAIIGLADKIVAPVPQFVVAASQTLALTRATHQGATIILDGAGATISFSATTQGNGFVFSLKNRTGANWTVPAFAGATTEYSKAAAHTLVESAGDASFEVYTRSSVMYVSVMGDTA